MTTLTKEFRRHFALTRIRMLIASETLRCGFEQKKKNIENLNIGAEQYLLLFSEARQRMLNIIEKRIVIDGKALRVLNENKKGLGIVRTFREINELQKGEIIIINNLKRRISKMMAFVELKMVNDPQAEGMDQLLSKLIEMGEYFDAYGQNLERQSQVLRAKKLDKVIEANERAYLHDVEELYNQQGELMRDLCKIETELIGIITQIVEAAIRQAHRLMLEPKIAKGPVLKMIARIAFVSAVVGVIVVGSSMDNHIEKAVNNAHVSMETQVDGLLHALEVKGPKILEDPSLFELLKREKGVLE